MSTQQLPATLQLEVSKKMKPFIKTTAQLPLAYDQLRISGAQVQYTQGPFGCYFTQEIKTADWVIGWLQLFLQSSINLYASTSSPMVSFYGGIEGSIACYLEGDGKLLLQEATCGLYYVPPDSRNKIKFRKANYDGVYISFSPVFLAGFVKQHHILKSAYTWLQQSMQEGKQLSAIKIGAAEMALFTQMRHCPYEGTDRDVYLDLLVRELLFLHLTRQQKENLLPQHQLQARSKQIQQVVDYMTAFYYQPLSITQLARMAVMSRTCFLREFKRVCHNTPVVYLQTCRVQRGAALLTETNMPVSDIAGAIGFGGQAYFALVFQKHFGISPLQYRFKQQRSAGKDLG